MVASVLELDWNDMNYLKIRDSYAVHKVVYSLFPKEEGETRPFLFYESKHGSRKKRIMILSKREPNTPEYGKLSTRRIPEGFLEQETYGFQIRMNPVIRKSGSKKPTPITNREELLDWFSRRATDFGFTIAEGTLQVSRVGVQQIQKGEKRITHGEATFSGVLRVEDRERFIESFRNGIGRGKAFGFGLLQLKPLE